jgi:hypothetical protein
MAFFGEELSDEVVATICSYLDVRSLGRLACVARRFTEHTLTEPAEEGGRQLSPIEDGARRSSAQLLHEVRATLLWPTLGMAPQPPRDTSAASQDAYAARLATWHAQRGQHESSWGLGKRGHETYLQFRRRLEGAVGNQHANIPTRELTMVRCNYAASFVLPTAAAPCRFCADWLTDSRCRTRS